MTTTSSCEYCGAEYVPRHVTSKYCDDCRHPTKGGLKANLRIRQKTFVCKACEREYSPTQWDQQYCSPECSHRAPERIAKIIESCDRSPPPNKLHDEVHAFRRWANGQRRRADYQARRQAKRRAEYEQRKRMRKYSKPCATCHEWFIPKVKTQLCCSSWCSGERSRRMQRARRRVRERGGNVDPLAVFARDRWHCQCCGIYTQPELRGSCEPDAPELDHIVPLSKGGEHSVSNTQLLCRACNGAKSDHLWPHPFVASWPNPQALVRD